MAKQRVLYYYDIKAKKVDTTTNLKMFSDLRVFGKSYNFIFLGRYTDMQNKPYLKNGKIVIDEVNGTKCIENLKARGIL